VPSLRERRVTRTTNPHVSISMFQFIRRASPLWGNADFNRLWAAQMLSAFGSRITRTALTYAP
jgi:hypothetical protein